MKEAWKVVLLVCSLLCFVSSRSILGVFSCHGGISNKKLSMVMPSENPRDFRSSRILKEKGLVKLFRF